MAVRCQGNAISVRATPREAHSSSRSCREAGRSSDVQVSSAVNALDAGSCRTLKLLSPSKALQTLMALIASTATVPWVKFACASRVKLYVSDIGRMANFNRCARMLAPQGVQRNRHHRCVEFVEIQRYIGVGRLRRNLLPQCAVQWSRRVQARPNDRWVPDS